MNERIKIEDLDNLRKVHEVMVKLSLPNLAADALKAVGKMEGDKFKKAIVSIGNNEDAMNHNKGYVHSVTALLTGPVQSILASMNYILPYETLIKIGQECGREFRTHLSAAAQNDAAAIQWIQQKVTEHGASLPTNAVKTNNAPSNHSSAQNVRNINTAPQNNRARENQPDLSGEYNPYPDNQKGRAQSSESSSEREFFSMTFYGGKSALCFNATEKDGDYSINVDAGNKKPNQKEGGREIDWKDKVIFGFSADELIEFAWVLLGVSQECNFSGHGPMHDKSLQFKRQDTGFFASVSAKDKGARAVPLSYAAGLRLMLLVSRQLKKNFPDMTVNEITMMLKTMAKPSSRPTQAPRSANA